MTNEAPHILILAGQSNTVGRGDPSADLPDDLVARADGLQIAFDLEAHRPDEAHASDGWTALTPTCQRNPRYGAHFGPEWGAACKLRDTFPRLLIAKFAMGSSSLLITRAEATEPAEWSAESDHRTRFLGWLAALRSSAGPDARFVGCLWNQGNSDLKVKPNDGSPGEYTARLTQLIADLRAATDSPGLPFVATEVWKGSQKTTALRPKDAKNTKHVNDALRAACAAAGCATCLPLPANALLQPDDEFHLDGSTLLAAGAEAADELLRLSAARPPPPTAGSATPPPPADAAPPAAAESAAAPSVDAVG